MRRSWPDATGDQLERHIDWALDFTAGPGKSRPQALLMWWRGAIVATERQRGRTLAEVGDRLRTLEGGADGFTTRYLETCLNRAVAIEARIDGASWPKLYRRHIRRLLDARDRYRQAQLRLLAINFELLTAAEQVGAGERSHSSAADRVRAFVDGSTPAPDWLAAAYTGADAKRKASELRQRRLRAVRARNRAAQRFEGQVERLLPHLTSHQRPAIDTGSALDELAALAAANADTMGMRGAGNVERLASTVESAEDVVSSRERVQTLRQALASLPPREREVIELRFGFEDQPLDASEVAQRVGVQPAEVTELEEAALAALRRAEGIGALVSR